MREKTKKYRKKPVEVEAYQFIGQKPLPEPLIGNWDNNPMTPSKVSIKTLKGYMNVSINDYIIKGVKGEYYACKPDVFDMSYEEVAECNCEAPQREAGFSYCEVCHKHVAEERLKELIDKD